MTKKKEAKNTPQKPENKRNATKTTTTNKKTDTSMKKTNKEKNTKEKKDKTKEQPLTSTKKASSETTSTKKDQKTKEKNPSTKNSSKEKNKRTTNKPKNKKTYDEDDIFDDEILDKDELEDDEDEITEVEEIDISNIDPPIADIESVLDEDEDEDVPKSRGRKKQALPEVSQQQTLEEIIRNRPLQIDPTQKTYVTKKEEEPKPFIASSTSSKERYSDQELQEFKEIILQKLKETKENYEQLKKYFTNEDNNGIDDTSPTFKMIEDGSGVMTKEEIEQQLSRLEKYMIDLQNALLRIENKTYGICTVTGKLIPKERLRSVPHATKSIEAKINRDN